MPIPNLPQIGSARCLSLLSFALYATTGNASNGGARRQCRVHASRKYETEMSPIRNTVLAMKFGCESNLLCVNYP